MNIKSQKSFSYELSLSVLNVKCLRPKLLNARNAYMPDNCNLDI